MFLNVQSKISLRIGNLQMLLEIELFKKYIYNNDNNNNDDDDDNDNYQYHRYYHYHYFNFYNKEVFF